MNKNLFMIMCHKNLDQVLLLAKKLITSESDVVIHIDSFVSDSEVNAFMQLSKDIPNLYITDKRIHGVLDRRSLVDIVFIMINYVKSKGLCYKYYCLLSGQDYPIKPIDKINKELSKCYPEPFIDCTPYDKNNWIYHKFLFTPTLLKFHQLISDEFSPKNPIRKILRLSEIIIKKLCSLLKITSYDKLTKNGIALYGGSAWWILPDIAIEYIWNEYSIATETVNYLLSTYTPEETFFQIMVMMSPVRNSVAINPPDKVDQNCKTWAYFSDVDKPFKGHPYVFTVKEFEKIKYSRFWFARKFDMKTDAEIIGLIDQQLLNGKHS